MTAHSDITIVIIIITSGGIVVATIVVHSRPAQAQGSRQVESGRVESSRVERMNDKRERERDTHTGGICVVIVFFFFFKWPLAKFEAGSAPKSSNATQRNKQTNIRRRLRRRRRHHHHCQHQPVNENSSEFRMNALTASLRFNFRLGFCLVCAFLLSL